MNVFVINNVKTVDKKCLVSSSLNILFLSVLMFLSAAFYPFFILSPFLFVPIFILFDLPFPCFYLPYSYFNINFNFLLYLREYEAR